MAYLIIPYTKAVKSLKKNIAIASNVPKWSATSKIISIFSVIVSEPIPNISLNIISGHPVITSLLFPI